jgi:hypothetical protein
MRNLRLALAAPALLLAAACVIVPKDLPDEKFTAALVDSVSWNTTLDRKTLWRVEVRTDSSADTVPDILTDRAVVAVPKVGVEGFAFDTARGAIHQGFRYDPKKKSVKTIVLAEDLVGPFAAPALSPDGRHVAYLAVADGRARPMVRLFPRGRVVASGPAVPVPPGDAPPGDAAWASADSFALHVDALPFRRIRFRGSVRGGALAVDTVPGREPEPPPAP